MDQKCTSCKKTRNWKILSSSRSSVLSTLLIIIIPKCPICIMAYTSAVTMCGGADMYYAQNNWISYIPLLLGLAILVMLFFNYKGRQTWLAASIALAGFAMIVLTHQLVIPSLYYNAGTILFILAIWINGSFSSFISALKNLIHKAGIAWQR